MLDPLLTTKFLGVPSVFLAVIVDSSISRSNTTLISTSDDLLDEPSVGKVEIIRGGGNERI